MKTTRFCPENRKFIHSVKEEIVISNVEPTVVRPVPVVLPSAAPAAPVSGVGVHVASAETAMSRSRGPKSDVSCTFPERMQYLVFTLELARFGIHELEFRFKITLFKKS